MDQKILSVILEDLQDHHRTQDVALFDAVKTRLDASHQVYNHELDQVIDYLGRRKNIRTVSKRLTKRLNEKTKL